MEDATSTDVDTYVLVSRRWMWEGDGLGHRVYGVTGCGSSYPLYCLCCYMTVMNGLHGDNPFSIGSINCL